MVLFDSKTLTTLMHRILEDYGVHSDSAKHVISSLVQTSLRGVDSHGINNFPHYCRAIQAERVNKNPNIKIAQTGSSVAIVDADHAFGHHAGATAVDLSTDLAKKSGIAAVGVKNSTHFGAAAYFGLRPADRNCLGFAFTNADALVKAYGAKDSFFGTNPICFTAPMEKEEPFCLDMATSLVSWNKIRIYRRENKEIPSHWAFDTNGLAETNANKARSLSPIGEYKGFGLGMLIDILCALLSDGPISKDIMPMFEQIDSQKRSIGHFFMSLDISKFIDPETFKHNLQNMADRVRRMEPSSPREKVMVPGDPEKETYKERVKTGIPVDDIKIEEFLDLSPDFKKAILL